MAKIGIITLNGYFNYGNRLQNYALQEMLKDLGFEVETIINDSLQIRSEGKRKIERIKGKSFKELYLTSIKMVENFLYKNKLDRQRSQIFRDFSRMYLSETNYAISENNIPSNLTDRYDYFITGSDQVWNPNYREGSSIEFLTFAAPEKRISYAPSFGVSEIPDVYRDSYSKWLKEIPHLSVREKAGAQIIKDLTGRNAKVVLDPTMMLSTEKWLSISKASPNKPNGKYLLTYFLGNITKERHKILYEIARNNNLEIVNLAQVKDKKHYLTGPSEFIDYINSASVFYTDSFHGAVFSILLNTPFVVFNRKGKGPSMNSRIETLLETFDLESRHVKNIKSNSQIFEIDYSHIIPVLDEEREKSMNFLKSALNIK